jgi:hypothetical protein
MVRSAKGWAMAFIMDVVSGNLDAVINLLKFA